MAWNENNQAYQDEPGYGVGRATDGDLRHAQHPRLRPRHRRPHPKHPQAQTPRELDYTVHISSHEADEPVITLMLAHED